MIDLIKKRMDIHDEDLARIREKLARLERLIGTLRHTEPRGGD